MSKKPFLSSEETERRLRPAMSSLTARNPRQALRQASKHLPHPSAIAVYSLALLHLGRIDEAEAFVGQNWPQALAAVNGDAAHKIGMFWRELRRLDKVGEGFLKAWELEKGAEMGEMAFVSALASEDWGAAGRTAAKLQKLDRQRGLWAALAAYMHGITEAGGEKLLGLSSAMVKRRFAESKNIKTDEARFCVRVLKAAREWKMAREVLQMTEGLEEIEKKLEEASILEGECKWEEARHAYAALIEKDPEDWDCWLRWMRLHGNPEEILAGSSILMAFLRKYDLESSVEGKKEERCELSEKENASSGLDSKAYWRRSRAVHLAEIEVLKRCGRFEEMYDKCIQYFRTFCTYPICAQDLRPYFLSLISNHPPASSHSIISRLFSCTTANPSPAVSSVLSLLKMWLPEIPREHIFVDRFEAPNFYLFTAHSQIRVSSEPDKADDIHSEYISCIKATLTLEEGLNHYPSDMLLSLALLQLYLKIGAVDPGIKVLKSLEIKFIQLCSLHYLLLPRLVLLCPSSKLVNEEVLTPILELQSRQWKDYFLALPSALQNGCINSATDTVFFQRRLSKSEAFARAIVARASRFVSESLSCLCSDSSEIPLNSLSMVERDLLHLQGAIEELTDDRDLELMTFWSSSAYEPRNRELVLDRGDRGEEVQGRKLSELQRAELVYYTACLCKVVERLGEKLRRLEQERTNSTKEKKAGRRKIGKREGRKKSAKGDTVRSKRREAQTTEEKLSLAVESVKLSDESLKLPPDSYMESLTNLADHPDNNAAEQKCCDHLIKTSRRLRMTLGIYADGEKGADEEESTLLSKEELRCINGCRLHELGKFIYETIQWTVALICSCEMGHEQLHQAVAKTIANLESILKQAVASSPNPLFRNMRASSETGQLLDRGVMSVADAPKTLNERQQQNQMTFRIRVLTEIEKSQRDTITRMLESLQAAHKCLRKVK